MVKLTYSNFYWEIVSMKQMEVKPAAITSYVKPFRLLHRAPPF